jgi:hypothetical protein
VSDFLDDMDSCWLCCHVILQVVGGSQGVVAIVPQGVKREAVAECADALVMRVKDAAAATELRKKLTQSASQMSAVAGLLMVRIHLVLSCVVQLF